MKKRYLTLLFVATTSVAFGQSSFIFSGGWATARSDNSNATINGFKIGAVWEKRMGQSPWAVDFGISYLYFSRNGSGPIINDLTTRYRSIPVNVYGKYLIGKDRLQGYAKGGVGVQFSRLNAEGTVGSVSEKDFGFSLGLGLGGKYFLSEKLFLNLDYEFLHMSNTWYTSGVANAVTLGIGLKLK